MKRFFCIYAPVLLAAALKNIASMYKPLSIKDVYNSIILYAFLLIKRGLAQLTYNCKSIPVLKNLTILKKYALFMYPCVISPKVYWTSHSTK